MKLGWLDERMERGSSLGGAGGHGDGRMEGAPR